MDMHSSAQDQAPVDLFPIQGTDYIEFYVGNALQAAHFYQSVFGFQPLAYAGPETGVLDRSSYVLQQGKIRLVITASLLAQGEIAEHVHRHGDGVSVVALSVPNAEAAHALTLTKGAVSCLSPQVLEDEHGLVHLSGIRIYGDTRHIFVDRSAYRGPFLPGYKPWNPHFRSEETGLLHIDHAVANVGWNQMNEWVSFYRDVMGFHNLISFDDQTISTEYSALMSKVMANGNGRIKFPINEPAHGKKKSQIEEYLDFYQGPGIQHLALACTDIVRTVRALKNRGLEFLRVPDRYYQDLTQRVGRLEEDAGQLRDLGILVDRDEEGYLLQIFSKPLQDRPTVFVEIIERKGAKSFGAGNFKALFEAMEREQALRGNL